MKQRYFVDCLIPSLFRWLLRIQQFITLQAESSAFILFRADCSPNSLVIHRSINGIPQTSFRAQMFAIQFNQLRSDPPISPCFFTRAFSLGSVRCSDRESWLSKLLHVRTIDPGKSSHSITLADPKAEKIYELQIHSANPKDRDQYIGV